MVDAVDIASSPKSVGCDVGCGDECGFDRTFSSQHTENKGIAMSASNSVIASSSKSVGCDVGFSVCHRIFTEIRYYQREQAQHRIGSASYLKKQRTLRVLQPAASFFCTIDMYFHGLSAGLYIFIFKCFENRSMFFQHCCQIIVAVHRLHSLVFQEGLIG